MQAMKMTKLDYVILTACITVWIRSNTTPFQLLFEVDFGAFPNGWVGPLLYDYSQDSNIYIKCLKTYKVFENIHMRSESKFSAPHTFVMEIFFMK